MLKVHMSLPVADLNATEGLLLDVVRRSAEQEEG